MEKDPGHTNQLHDLSAEERRSLELEELACTLALREQCKAAGTWTCEQEKQMDQELGRLVDGEKEIVFGRARAILENQAKQGKVA